MGPRKDRVEHREESVSQWILHFYNSFYRVTSEFNSFVDRGDYDALVLCQLDCIDGLVGGLFADRNGELIIQRLCIAF